MTTIAIDAKGSAAADGWRTWGGEIVGREEEKLRVRHGRMYGFTGMAPAFEPMIAWHAAGADPEKLPKLGGDDDAWTLIVIDGPGKVCKYTKTCPYPECFDPPIAFGAGIDLAKGAMLFGASAEEAVRVVAQNTNHTGGRIRVYDIAEALGLSSGGPDKVQEAAE